MTIERTQMDLPDLDFLLKQYSESFRTYHNMDHIRTLLSAFNGRPEVKQLNDMQKHSLYLAIWRHDVFYHIPRHASSNEELSARYHESITTMFSDASEAIRATEFHFDKSKYDNIVVNLMLDLDLLTFTWDYDKFKQTNLNIDKEYLSFYDVDYVNQNRLKFLKGILENKSLQYRILDNKNELTEIAYDNIQRYVGERIVELGL